MKCALCQGQVRSGEPVCPDCANPLEMAEPPVGARVVEGSIEPGDGSQFAYMPPRAPSSPETRSLVPVAPVQSALAGLSRLPALAWQQPAVRSAVTTGASAVALTVALRLAGRFVASRGGRQVASASLLPLLAEMLQQGEGAPQPTRRRRAREVTETFIYLRRTVRQ